MSSPACSLFHAASLLILITQKCQVTSQISLECPPMVVIDFEGVQLWEGSLSWREPLMTTKQTIKFEAYFKLELWQLSCGNTGIEELTIKPRKGVREVGETSANHRNRVCCRFPCWRWMQIWHGDTSGITDSHNKRKRRWQATTPMREKGQPTEKAKSYLVRRWCRESNGQTLVSHLQHSSTFSIRKSGKHDITLSWYRSESHGWSKKKVKLR